MVPSTEAHTITAHNPHTEEYATINLDKEDDLKKLDYIARDWRVKQQCRIDRKTIGWLHQILRNLRMDNAQVEIVSGYRTLQTNNKVGGKKRSQHMVCKALDIRVVGVSNYRVWEAAKRSQVGGLGYYPKHGFIHIDSGRIRSW
ncbi:YcbK family protein (plasmid) [Halobacteriovorax sp. GFR7]|uniref:YcbK family protein n=1 Tax=unclassified Halobacteriovorax TaxID=2639665 RepID=UPI003D968E42